MADLAKGRRISLTNGGCVTIIKELGRGGQGILSRRFEWRTKGSEMVSDCTRREVLQKSRKEHHEWCSF